MKLLIQEFILMLLFKELKDFLLLLLTILITVETKLKEIVIKKIFFKSKYN